MRLKAGVFTYGIQPEIILGLMICERWMYDKGFELVVTSLTDGGHREGSLHYQGKAADIRSHDLVPAKNGGLDYRDKFLAEVRPRLGGEYDLILEDRDQPNEHFHLEYDPKWETTGAEVTV